MTEKNPTITPDAELDRLLLRLTDHSVVNLTHEERMEELFSDERETFAAIHAHAEQAKQEAYDIGFRRGLREVGQEISAPGMTDLMVPPETIPDYQPPK